LDTKIGYDVLSTVSPASLLLAGRWVTPTTVNGRKMLEQQLFQIALQIEDPLYVREVVFSPDEGQLNLYLDFKRGGKFSCPECFTPDLPVQNTVAKTWRHLNFFQYKCYIHLRTPRVICKCGVRLWTPPWSHARSGFTMLFEALIMMLAKTMPILSIATLVDEHDTRIWRIVNRYVSKAYAKKCFASVKNLGIDETSAKRGHKYITVITDMDDGSVLFVTPGKDSETVAKFAQELLLRGCNPEQIENVASDMSRAFISGITNYLPNAQITFSKFHLMRALNECLDEIRRKEQASNPILKKTRFVWLKNIENLTTAQARKLETLRYENLKTARAYQMKITFQDIFRNSSNSEEAYALIKKWLGWADRSRLEPIRAFARMVKNHLQGILRYFDTRLTTGVVEGINSRIQEVKRRAKGFRNINNFIIMIYLIAGNLNFDLHQTYSK
jgi:transposase